MTAPILGEGIAGLRALPAGCVDLVFSDLPSGETRAPTDIPVPLPDLWAAIRHCLAPDGCAVLMASSLRYASALLASNSAWFRYDLVWEKPRATGHLNANRAPLRAHEFLLVFANAATRYYPQKTEGHRPVSSGPRTGHGRNYGGGAGKDQRGQTDRYPRSVLHYAQVNTNARGKTHHQQKPVDLLRWVVRTYTPDGGVVADPCAGSGSMLVAAEAEGRQAIGWDTDPRFGR